MALRIALLVIAAALAPSFAHAETKAHAKWAKAIYRASGIDPVLQSASAQVVQGMGPQVTQMPPFVRKAIERAALTEYDGKILKRDVLARIETKIEPARAEPVMGWLESKRGRAFTKAEEAMADPELMARVQTWSELPENANPPASRLALVRRIDTASGATDFAVDLSLATALAVAVAADATSGSPKQLESLRQMLDAERPRMRSQMQGITRVTYLYVYRGFSDAELEPYVAFLESENGKWYSQITSQAVLGAFTASASRMGSALKKELGALSTSEAL